MRSLFLALAVTALVALWGLMALNGTLNAISHAKVSSLLPSGRALVTTFTGFPPLDDGIATLVAFFDGVTNGSSLRSSLLMLDLVAMVQCINVWFMVDGFNMKEQNDFVRNPTIWSLAMEAVGMAFILPIYCSIRIATPYPKGSGLSIGDGHALIVSIIISSIPTILLALPPLIIWSRTQQQYFIALYQLTPVIFTVIQQMGAAFINQFQYRKEIDASSHRNVSRAFITMAIFGGLGHVYVLVKSILSANPLQTLSQIYIPGPHNLNKFPADRLTAGAHLFSQYDYLLSSITVLFFVYNQLAAQIKSELLLSRIQTKTTLFIALFLSTVILGPGSTLMLALWAREKFVPIGNQVREKY